MIKKWTQDMLTKIKPGVAVKIQSAQLAAVSDFLAVMPWTHYQKHLVVGRVLRLDRLVNRDCPIDVFLVPKTMNQHHRYLQRFFRQQLVDCLLAPERIVTRMLKQLSPETSLFQSATLSQLSR